MKNHLLLFLAPVLLATSAAAVSLPSNAPDVEEKIEPVLPAPKNAYSGSLPQFDPADVQNSVIIHYHRTDDKYDDYALWLWDHGNGGEGSEYAANGIDDYGSVFAYPLSTWSPGNWSKLDLGVIVKSVGSWAEKDPDGDRYIVMSDLTMDDNGNYSVWLWTGITAIYTKEVAYPYFLSRVYFQDFQHIVVTSGNGDFTYISLYRNGEPFMDVAVEGGAKRKVIELEEKASLLNTYSVSVDYGNELTLESPVDVSSLYETEEFLENFTYDGDDLGANYTAESTTFKVWSPMSADIELRIYPNGTPVAVDPNRGDDTYQSYPMQQGDYGVWTAMVNGDLEGQYYTYVVANSKYAGKEIVDPYAKSSGINGLRGQIVDFAKTNPEGWDAFDKALPIEKTALTVYETHVADITNHETWTGTEQKRGTYLGMAEEGTKYTKGEKTVKTGFDHIKELGVNAVQLQPIFDQANEERPELRKFNWGYNPLNYNVLDGAYSGDPYDGYAKIREFKTLVKAYHDAGINVIMDVVYNHVNSVENQLFDVLAPGYFFRYNAAGGLSNGSGCGNETASDRVMFHKYMVESTSFWAKEYKLGGFRFDLMALHDLDTMDDLTAKLTEINPKIAVYGEPWTGGGTTLPSNKQASQANGSQFKGYGQFNDGMRDTLVMSGMKDVKDIGVAYNRFSKPLTAQITNLKAGLKGFTVSTGTVNESLKTVNYVSCHDNFTIDDRILAFENAIGDKYPASTVEERAKMNLYAQSFALTSQGTSFFLAGEEMLRSKFEQTPENLTLKERFDYAHNSYNTTDAIDGAVVNALDYSRKIDHPELFENYKALIALKQTLPGLQQDIHRLAGDDTSSLVKIEANEERNQIFNKFTSGETDYMVIYNGGYGELPKLNLAGYEVVFNSSSKEVKGAANQEMEHFQVLVVKKVGELPPDPGTSADTSADVGPTPAPSNPGNNVGLIIGIVVAVVVVLAAIATVLIVLNKRKGKKE